jgi:hypothetical protein
MTLDNFWEIHNMIKDHQVFQRAEPSGRSQAPSAFQLLVLLKYLGSQGNAASNQNLATHFRIGRGTAESYRKRALTAILSLELQAYIWPDQDERLEISKRIRMYHYFPNCVGMIDGTLLPLQFKPTEYGENYYSRKKIYAVQMLVVCDDTTRINYYHCGWPGSVHDNRVWKTCRMGRKPDQYFARNEYLLGDSAFQTGPHIVPAFKSTSGQLMDPNEAAFNKLLSSPRVRSEHCIGVLKGRFAWLKDIRILIASADDARKIVDYVRATVILHNLLIGAPREDEWLVHDEDHFLELGNDDELNREIGQNGVENETDRRKQLLSFFAEEGIGGVI